MSQHTMGEQLSGQSGLVLDWSAAGRLAEVMHALAIELNAVRGADDHPDCPRRVRDTDRCCSDRVPASRCCCAARTGTHAHATPRCAMTWWNCRQSERAQALWLPKMEGLRPAGG